MLEVPAHELPLRAEFPLCAPWRPGRATRAGGGVAAGASARMATPGQRRSHVRGSVDRAWLPAPSSLSASRATRDGSPFRTPRAPCVSGGPRDRGARRGALDPPRAPTPAGRWLPQRLPPRHSAVTTPEPQTHPPPRAPRRPHPRRPADLPEPPSTTCGCGWFPGAETLLCRTLPAAGSTCDMPGAPPARPAPPRSLAEERPRGPPPPARGALPSGTLWPPASARPRTCRPPPSAPPPRASRSPGACGRRAQPGFPRPRPRPPACASPSLPAPPAPTPAPFPPLPALSPHLGVPNPTPAAASRRAPALRGSHVVAWKPGREREAHPRGATPRRPGVGETQSSLWGPPAALGDLGLRNTRGWSCAGLLTGPISAFACAPAPPPPRAGVTVSGTFFAATGRAGATLTPSSTHRSPTCEAQPRGGTAGFAGSRCAP